MSSNPVSLSWAWETWAFPIQWVILFYPSANLLMIRAPSWILISLVIFPFPNRASVRGVSLSQGLTRVFRLWNVKHRDHHEMLTNTPSLAKPTPEEGFRTWEVSPHVYGPRHGWGAPGCAELGIYPVTHNSRLTNPIWDSSAPRCKPQNWKLFPKKTELHICYCTIPLTDNCWPRYLYHHACTGHIKGL